MDKVWASLLTIVLEFIAFVFFYSKLTKKQFVLLSLVSIPLNLITNLSLNSFLTLFFSQTVVVYIIVLLASEILVVIVEGLVYQLVIPQKSLAWKISLFANLTSFVIGTLIYNLL
ncbi:MAG: hypothetical protein PHG08_05965 [Bacilli bacterium]|nr:hypothetical protein [Bacilli bacterium]HHU23914.1 hypothetical protein [Acholeplasmataceae bacterium]